MTLGKTTLIHDDKGDKWKLTDDKTDRTVRSFDTKSEATAGGVLRRRSEAKAGLSRSRRKTVATRRSGHFLDRPIQRRRKGKLFRQTGDDRCFRSPAFV